MRACLRPVVVAASLVAPLTLGAAWAAAAGPSTGAAPTSTTIVAVAPTVAVAAPTTPAAIVAAAFQQTLSSPSQFALYADIVGTSVDLSGDRAIATGVITPDGVSIDIDLAPLFGLLGIEVTDVDTHVEVIRRLKLRYRGVTRNHAWLKRRTAAVNLRNLLGRGLTRLTAPGNASHLTKRPGSAKARPALPACSQTARRDAQCPACQGNPPRPQGLDTARTQHQPL